MYLSRIQLDISKRRTQLALASPSKLHGAVEEAFSQKQRRNLWRIDTLGGNTYLLILSSEKPQLSNITDQFGYENIAGESKNYGKLLSRVEKGSTWHFRLVANPTRSIKKEGERGKVTAHTAEKYQLEWLKLQSEKKGFYIFPDTVRVQGSNWKVFYKQGSKQKVRILEVAFEGRLKVEDADVFKDALVNGIGREKAYGMGLLTIARNGG